MDDVAATKAIYDKIYPYLFDGPLTPAA
jgi:hypothetical protein